MIPHTLQLKNFLSYGPELQTISFSDYHLICLSGKNGHGKSALLDAITWAVWGVARKVARQAKADQGLLRLGAGQMMVIFDFECNGQLYRIKREFMFRCNKPYATLEFGILSDDGQTVTPLTDKTIKKTQEKIEKTINLTYDAFVNSAFLRQGNSNEFSRKSAKERKEILASILGLDKFDTLKKKAQEKIRDANSHKQAFCTLQEKISSELETKQELTVQLTQTTKQLNDCADQEKKLQTEKQTLVQKQHKQQQLIQEYQLLNYQVEQLNIQREQTTTEFKSLTATWRRIHAQQLRLQQGASLAHKKKLQQKINQAQEQLAQQFTLKEQLYKEKELLQKRTAQLQEEHTKADHEYVRLFEKLKTEQKTLTQQQAEYECTLKEKDQQLKELEQTISTKQQEIPSYAAITDITTYIAASQTEFDTKKEQYHTLIAQGTVATSELKQLAQKQVFTKDEESPSCPLCEQNLSASRKKFLKKKFNQTEDELNTQITQLREKVAQLKTDLVAHHKQLETMHVIADLNKQHTTALQEVDQITKKLDEIDTHHKQLLKQQKEQKQKYTTFKTDYTQICEHDEQLKESMQQIDTLEQQLKKNTYNEQKHKQAVHELQQLEQQEADRELVRKESALQDERKQHIAQLNKQIKQLNTQHKKLTEQLKKYATLEKDQATLAHQEQELTNQSKQLQKEKEQLLQQRGRLEQQQLKLAQLEKEHKAQQSEIKKLEHTADDYFHIAAATGKDGIQALLIEQAIPEIEQEANELLGKLTDNQAHIIIDSLRDLKRGGTKETLDIKISDAMGIRPYELFSGGEAFRIDFALRIAISKLLARRAGTALQTLIIDEGFGSQDEEGLSMIMDSLYRIQDDFVKIIVVSHLTSMKDQFPVHFIVEKGAQGSVIQIKEQG